MLAAFVAYSILKADLDAILDSPDLHGTAMSATVLSADGKVLYERNPATRLLPASNQKLLTAAYALARLGPDFTPQTRIWKLFDRIVVDAPGDPSLSFAALEAKGKELDPEHKLPVFAKQAYRVGIPDSWELDDLPNRYAAPVTAFAVDQGAVELWAENGKAFLLPAAFGLRIATDSSLEPNKSRYDYFGATVYVSDRLPKEKKRLDTLALRDPDKAAASLLGHGLESATGLPTAEPACALTGQPLRTALHTCLVKSDNNMAENFFLIAAGTEGPLGADPYMEARKRETRFLETTVGLNKDEARVYDGSGMSRHNFVCSHAIASLLLWESKQPTAPLWEMLLAEPGAGTLTTRLKNVEFRGKTGTLDSTVALSGYVKCRNGANVVVSMLLNNFACTTAKARDIVDSFIRRLANNSHGTTVAIPKAQHEGRHPNAHPWTPHGHRVHRPGHHRRAVSARNDRGAESADAAHAGAQRVAVRVS